MAPRKSQAEVALENQVALMQLRITTLSSQIDQTHAQIEILRETKTKLEDEIYRLRNTREHKSEAVRWRHDGMQVRGELRRDRIEERSEGE